MKFDFVLLVGSSLSKVDLKALSTHKLMYFSFTQYSGSLCPKNRGPSRRKHTLCQTSDSEKFSFIKRVEDLAHIDTAYRYVIISISICQHSYHQSTMYRTDPFGFHRFFKQWCCFRREGTLAFCIFIQRGKLLNTMI